MIICEYVFYIGYSMRYSLVANLILYTLFLSPYLMLCNNIYTYCNHLKAIVTVA